MDMPHQLQALLQFLVTDASSVAHLAYILDHLSASCLAPSPHLQKWVTRVTSLMHSKDLAARWAGICIAYRISCLSRSLLVEHAQSWIGIIFPSLSKPEPVPILKASMRYLTLVLCAARHNLEFQRQVAIPIVPKVSLALLSIAERNNDRDIKASSIRSLSQLVPLYPSFHKSLSQRLFALCHQIFGGSVHHTPDSLLDAATSLYAVLHFLGGKVGGINMWRNCLDEVLQVSWSAWLALRTTFPTSAKLSHKVVACLCSPDGKLPNPLPPTDTTSDPLMIVALQLDRLKCGISAIEALLSVPVHRPVRVPVGHLAAFSWCLLASTCDDEGQAHFDPHARVAESVAAPQIWMQACRMLSRLAQSLQELLAPHASRLILLISSHLENSHEPSQRRSFLSCAYHLLYFCPAAGATLGINRLLKATLSLLSPLYHHQPPSGLASGVASQTKASKKRRREYEAENVLSANNAAICTTTDECDILIMTLHVVDQCMLNVELAPSARSLTNRTLLSILLSLPSIPPSSLSSDPSFHGRMIQKVRDMCVESVQGTSHAMSKGTCLVLRSFSENVATRDKLHPHVDLLLHPRRPPYVRTLPFVDSLSFSPAGEGAEETTTRKSLRLASGNGETRPIAFKPQTHPEQVQLELTTRSKRSPDPQTPLDPPRERASPASTGQHPQSMTNTNINFSTDAPPFVCPVASPLQTEPDVPVGLLLPISQKETASTAHVVPMLVDEFDHEEVPTIDLGSDSDA